MTATDREIDLAERMATYREGLTSSSPLTAGIARDLMDIALQCAWDLTQEELWGTK